MSISKKLMNKEVKLSVIGLGYVGLPIALEFAKNKGLGLIITQPDMYPIEDMGLIKIDLLSQRSLGVLRDTLSSINRDEIKDSCLCWQRW